MGNFPSFRREFGLIVVGAVIFTATFLWKDLLSEIEEYLFPKGNGLMWRIIFTVFVTAILVLIAIELKRLFRLSERRVRSNKDILRDPKVRDDSNRDDLSGDLSGDSNEDDSNGDDDYYDIEEVDDAMNIIHNMSQAFSNLYMIQ